MKSILYTTAVALGAVVVMASCKDNNTLGAQSTAVTPVPASEYTAFKQWQQQQETNAPINYNAATTTATPVVIHKHYTIVNKVTPAKKKGWSKAAKGSVIGAGAGAAAGALLVKNNRGLGAVIGGIVGGGVGYGVGHSMDKKDGRY